MTESKFQWLARVSSEIYQLQKARFSYQPSYQDARKVAEKIYSTPNKEKYISALKQEIIELSISQNINTTANGEKAITTTDVTSILNSYWDTLAQAETDEEFARILLPHEPIASIDLHNEYVQSQGASIDISVRRYITNALTTSKNKFMTYKDLLYEVGKYSYGIAAFTLYNTAMKNNIFTQMAGDGRVVVEQTVPCVLSALPLRHVKSIEVAKSGEVLKFRAAGSVFLAKQEGGKTAVRIEGFLYREELPFIMALWMIFYFGQGNVKEIEDANIANNLETAAETLVKMRKNMDVSIFNKMTEKPSYEHHVTFPFVTRHVIIPNCYIETMVFEERVSYGMNVIWYTIMLRTYEKQASNFMVYTRSEKSSTEFIFPKISTFTKSLKLVEYVANIVWRYVSANGIILQNQSWKLTDYAGSDDVYYDIGLDDLAVMGFMGIIGFS